MTHVLIEDGLVVQLDLTDNPPQGYVECPEYVQPGYLFDGVDWISPDIPEPDIVTVIYPVDFWSKMTDEEVEQVEGAVSQQPMKIQNIFRTASSYRSDNELWPLLTSIAVTLFGEERAHEILS